MSETPPWFMAVGLVRPHIPFNCPGKYWDLNHDPFDSNNNSNKVDQSNEIVKEFGRSSSQAMQQMKTLSDNGFGEFRDFIPLELRDPVIFANALTYMDIASQESDVSIGGNVSGGGSKRNKIEKSVNQLKSDTRRGYRSCISFMDFEFGRIMKALSTSGQRDNTVVAFISDHGYKLGEFDM